MDRVFFVLLLLGAFVGLACIGAGIYLLFKRVTGHVEFEIAQLGRLKTTQVGVVLVIAGLLLFGDSAKTYTQTMKIRVVTSERDSFRKLTGYIVTSALIEDKDLIRFVKALPEEERSVVVIEAIDALRKKFREVTRSLGREAREVDFAHVEYLVNFLSGIDETSGHALYYRGEVNRRLTNPEGSHADFYLYLETERKLPKSERWGGTDVEECYQRANGYCRQRTAWIRHLMANDFYEKGVREVDENKKRQFFEIALRYVGGVWDAYPGGFVQYKTTKELEGKLLEELKKLRKI